MRVFRQSARKVDSSVRLGTAIKEIDIGRHHVGFIYREDNGSLRMCHLAFHCELRDDELPDSYFCGESGLDPANQAFMAAYVSRLKRNATVVAYGLDYSAAYFDELGNYVPQPVGKGLTCATFLMAVLEGRGFPLLKADGWPVREDDEEWHRWIIGVMEGRRIALDHVEAAKADIGAKRFRPAEVAGAITSPDCPLDYPAAHELAKEILSDIQG